MTQWYFTGRELNARQGPMIPPGIYAYEITPLEGLQVELTEMLK